jgi:phage-related protein
LRIRIYPGGDAGEVRGYLRALRCDARTRKAAVKLDLDLQTLEEFWPNTLNVTVRRLKGWEPLLELKRSYDKVAYRIFFCVRGDELWLLSAYEKHSQAAPRRELEKAFHRMKSILGESR